MDKNGITVLCKSISEEKLKCLASIDGLFDQDSSLFDENYRCVPNLVNFIKDQCAWLVSPKGNSCSPTKNVRLSANGSGINNTNSTDGKSECFDETKTENSSLCKDEKATLSEYKTVTGKYITENQANKTPLACNQKLLQLDSKSVAARKLDMTETLKNDRMMQKFTLGCEPYDRRKTGKKNQRFYKESLSLSQAVSTPAPDINSIDAFPPVGSECGIVSKSRRRITPTLLHPQKKATALPFSHVLSTIPADRVCNNSLFSDIPLQDEKDPKLVCEREMLKKTRSEFVKCNWDPPDVVLTSNDRSLSVEDSNSSPVNPDPVKVYDSNKLDILCDAYCHCLDHGLVPNIAGEIHFMFQILTSVGKANEVLDRNKILGTIHNCIYFAVSVLNQQKNLLSVLDDCTLKIFAEIPYLPEFSTELFSFVKSAFHENLLMKMPKSIPVPQAFFQVDTDNGNNFPNDTSFRSFRKQRDLFYELLRGWQQQNVFNSQFQHQFNKKVQHLIGLESHTINFMHLARLFQSQLIVSCLGTSESVVSYSGALGDIKSSFPDRFEKLEGRFSSPSNTTEMDPASFYGIQTFFCEFINAASSVTLNQHLLDNLACKIVELNEHEFLHSAMESKSQDEILSEYSSILNTLRLLAKFFGYLMFMPYKNTDVLPQMFVAFQSKLRRHTRPLLDVGSLLREALKRQTLVLTVPWVVDYLGMMDPVTLCLDHNKEILCILIKIYQGKFQEQISDKNLVFLKFVIGWLFDSPNFPQQMIFLLNSFHSIDTNSSSVKKNIDTFLKIHKHLIYACCPQLVKLKFMLDNYINGIKPTRDIRKIKPIPTVSVTLPSDSNRELQQQLEENFFSLRSPSLKKTVEFVADRIASRIIQHVTKEVQAMKLVVASSVVKDPEFPADKKTRKNKDILSKIVYRESVVLCDKAKLMARLLTEEKCLSEIETVFPCLISEDATKAMIKVCCQISNRLATTKIIEWCELNIVPEFIMEDIKKISEQSLKNDVFLSICSGKQVVSTCQTVLSETLISLRSIAIEIHKGNQDISIDQIIQLLNSLELSLAGEMEVGILRTIIILTVDIIVCLIGQLPWLCSEETISIFVSFWTIFPASVFGVEDILCLENIHCLHEYGDSNFSWCLFHLLLDQLLKQGIFGPEQVENHARNIPTVKLTKLSEERFASCIQGTLENFMEHKHAALPAVADHTSCKINDEVQDHRQQ